MRATIDKAGRLVIPKARRDRLSLVPGEVEVVADGSALRVELLAGDVLEEQNGRRPSRRSRYSPGCRRRPGGWRTPSAACWRSTFRKHASWAHQRPRHCSTGSGCSAVGEDRFTTPWWGQLRRARLPLVMRDRRALPMYRTIEVDVELLA